MKIRSYSDIHLDWYFANGAPFNPQTGEMRCWYPEKMEDELDTVLILSGDLWVGTKWIEWAGYSWIGEVSRRFKNVIVVLGNHDYWPQGHLSIKNGADKCNAMLQDMGFYNVYVLDCTSIEIGDILFVGATLWTDMNNGDPLTMHNMTNYLRYDGKIAFETGPNGAWSRFTPERWIGTHVRHRDYIKKTVEENADKKIVVCTHHVPLPTLCDPQFHSVGDGYYASDLSDIILDNPQIKLWTYGHTHYTLDTVLGETRLYNNSVGYTSEHKEQQYLVKHEIVEI